MSLSLEIVYQYRQLVAKCESSAGLTLEEIEQLSSLEDVLPGTTPVGLDAHLRTKKFIDPITVEAISRHGALVVACPYLEEGQVLELRIQARHHSYRFAARVRWARECDDDTYEAGLAFEGAPVLVRNTRELPAVDFHSIVANAA